jgi:hypothetical protein
LEISIKEITHTTNEHIKKLEKKWLILKLLEA